MTNASDFVTYEMMPGFKHVLLEESYVLGINEEETSIRFALDAVLLPGHPLYEVPKSDEAFCYRAAQLVVSGWSVLRWVKRSLQPSLDANGQIDYGNIDYLRFRNGSLELAGDWGELEAAGATCLIDIPSTEGG